MNRGLDDDAFLRALIVYDLGNNKVLTSCNALADVIFISALVETPHVLIGFSILVSSNLSVLSHTVHLDMMLD